LNRGLSEQQLNALIGDRDYKMFLNTRNELYRERKMKESPPARAEAIALMAKNPNLIKRPILIKGKRILLGFNPDEMRKAL
jgi:arsenate reductase-like glutaredoxin family protein